MFFCVYISLFLLCFCAAFCVINDDDDDDDDDDMRVYTAYTVSCVICDFVLHMLGVVKTLS